jgi:hypothetical protein
VWAGPPGSAGRVVRWPDDWEKWHDEQGIVRLAMPRRWDTQFQHVDIPLSVTLSVAIEGGRLACDRVVVSRQTGGQPVTTTSLRLPLGAMITRAAWGVSQATVEGLDTWEQVSAWRRARPRGFLPEDVARLPESYRAGAEVMEPGNWSDPVPVTALREMRRLTQSRTKRPRASNHEELLRKVAGRYRELTSSTNPDRAPSERIANDLGYNQGYIKKLVHEARKKGMLGPAFAGRSGEWFSPEPSPNGLTGG